MHPGPERIREPSPLRGRQLPRLGHLPHAAQQLAKNLCNDAWVAGYNGCSAHRRGAYVRPVAKVTHDPTEPIMRALLALAAAAALLISVGCSKQPVVPQANLRIQMTDAAGPYDAVNLVVTEVAVHLESGDTLSSWEVLDVGASTYDLTTLRNGVFATLATGLVPPGHYTQLRLKLGAGSNVVVGGVTCPLVVPSGMQSGYKLVGEFDVPATGLIELALDFDALRSIHQTGSGKYMLRPTVRVMPMYDVGAISGRVVPDSTEAWVCAIAGTDTVATTLPAIDGRFTLTPLAAGTYDVAIHPTGAWRDTTIAGVGVVAQQISALGDIQLTAK